MFGLQLQLKLGRFDEMKSGLESFRVSFVNVVGAELTGGCGKDMACQRNCWSTYMQGFFPLWLWAVGTEWTNNPAKTRDVSQHLAAADRPCARENANFLVWDRMWGCTFPVALLCGQSLLRRYTPKSCPKLENGKIALSYKEQKVGTLTTVVS